MLPENRIPLQNALQALKGAGKLLHIQLGDDLGTIKNLEDTGVPITPAQDAALITELDVQSV